jgi:thioredoxin reductase (NADPH)
LSVLSRLHLREEPVALIAADQRMPEMTGIEMLRQARSEAPAAKMLLVTAYADTDVAINAINDIGLDYYLLKPWDPPEERLYPILDDLLDDWRKANPDHTSDVRVIGHRWSDRSHEIKVFLARNHVPYRWYDVERDVEGERLRTLAQAAPEDLPLVLVPDGETLQSPSTLMLAGALGLHTNAQQPLYDLCIVGGGPAGLAAAVYGASEGLSTVIVEREAPGGQAGMSSAIENYLGFPKGLSGSDLAHRAIAQVSRFGAEMVLARDVVGFETRGPARTVILDGSGEIESRALVVATGVSYRLRHSARRGEPVRGGRCLRRRRSQLGWAGCVKPLSIRQASCAGGARQHACRNHVVLSDRQDRRRAQYCGALSQHGCCGAWRGPSRCADPRRHQDRRHRRRCIQLVVHLHRRGSAD